MTAEIVFFPDKVLSRRCQISVLRDQGTGIKPVLCNLPASGWYTKRGDGYEVRYRACAVHEGFIDDA